MAIRLPTPTDPGARAVLARQAAVMFELADDVLDGVTLEECVWQPHPDSWTVHHRDGRWFGELADEPPDLPTPSLGWTMWHPIWWLTTLLAHTTGDPVPEPNEVEWPGNDASLPTLRELWETWVDVVDALDEADLDAGTLTRFPYRDGRPFVHVVGWASMELTKNLSEMCLQRRLRRDLVGRSSDDG